MLERAVCLREWGIPMGCLNSYWGLAESGYLYAGAVCGLAARWESIIALLLAARKQPKDI